MGALLPESPQGPGRGLLLKIPGIIVQFVLHGTILWGTVERCMGTLGAVCAQQATAQPARLADDAVLRWSLIRWGQCQGLKAC